MFHSRFPWIEALGTVAGSFILYFVLKKHELAEFFAVVGGIMTLGRLGYSEFIERQIAEIREPLQRIREFFDFSRAAHVTTFRDMLQVHSQITEEEFAAVKEGIIQEARAELLQLANQKKSAVLPTTRYYGWLLPMLERARPPQRIWALSMMRGPEWDNSPPERRFIALSQEAAERGVKIDRVFVMRRDLLSEALRIEPVAAHTRERKPDNLRGFFVDEEGLKRSDMDLFSRLGDGFIVFDDRVALVDVFSNTARGYVTMSPTEIGHLKEVFERLQILGEELQAPSS